jgi:cell division transport system permease protein
VLVSPDEGLAEFRALSGLGEALSALPDNPLPWVVKVRPAPPYDTATAVEDLAGALRGMDQVELVEADAAWVRRLHAILDALRSLVLLIAVALGAGVLAIIGNTIRLEIDGRRAEIEVTKLVGGSNAFVRRPFLYSGFWHGLAGGLLAVGLVLVALAVLDAPIARLAAAYGGSFTLIGLAPRELLAVIGGGAALGLLGAGLAASYHLRRIEPRA